MRSIPENKIQGEDNIVPPNNSQDLTVNIAIGACLAFILVITVAAISTLIYRLWKNKKSRRDEEGQSHADEDRECHDNLNSLCSGKPNGEHEEKIKLIADDAPHGPKTENGDILEETKIPVSGPPDVVIGMPDEDVVTASGPSDVIIGMPDEDVVTASGPPDVIIGMPDEDVVTSSGTPDVIFGMPDEDVVTASGPSDVIVGMPDEDVVTASGPPDVIIGMPDEDVVTASGPSDVIIGMPDEDVVTISDPSDVIIGMPDEDVVTASDPSDVIIGMPDEDVVTASDEHQEDMVNIPPPPPPLPSYHTLFGQGADMNRSEGSMSDDKKDCDLQPQQTQEMPELHLDDLAGEWALPPVMDGWDRVTSADEGEEDTEDILLPRNIHTCQCGNMPFRVQLFVYFKTKDGDLLPM
ncbi:uncharacterized protein ACNLHF_025141 [Anomaloglossus baeobatrachus]